MNVYKNMRLKKETKERFDKHSSKKVADNFLNELLDMFEENKEYNKKDCVDMAKEIVDKYNVDCDKNAV